MTRQPINIYNERAWGMKNYLNNYGWHFNKRSQEYAAKRMMKRNDATGRLEMVEPWTKDEVDELLKRYGITLEYNVGYDYVYVANKAKADYYKSSLQEEEHVARFIKDTIDDPDGADGEIMQSWYCMMAARGIPVDWEDLV